MEGAKHFDTIAEAREAYFVEYSPARPEAGFSCLHLTFYEPTSNEAAEIAMLMEAEKWHGRFPVPQMIWAWDDRENSIFSGAGKGDGVLYFWKDEFAKTFSHSWTDDEFSSLTKVNTPLFNRDTIFRGIRYRTDGDIKRDAKKRLIETRRRNLALKFILLAWFSAIPLLLVVFKFFGPEWIGYMAFTYAIFQILRTTRKLMKSSPSEEENKKSELDALKSHYFYHCERNPDGFLRLKLENFEEDARKRTEKRIAEIKKA